MPFDGVVTKCIYKELSEIITGGRIEKIFQPEADEILINIRAKGKNLKLLMSASASHPRIHLTEIVKENPAAPPVFCMLLRKHLSGGKISEVGFHDYERIITISIEAINELGDPSSKKLIIEIMGRHSNIILINENDRIIDSIKHVDIEVSSVREVMPARPYILPPQQYKTSPDVLDTGAFISDLQKKSNAGTTSTEKILLENIKGFSPLLCREICFNAGFDGKLPFSSLDGCSVESLGKTLGIVLADIFENNFTPCLIYTGSNAEKPLDFHCLKISQYSCVKYMDSISSVLDLFYTAKDVVERLKQKKSGIVKVLNTSLERCSKKAALQQEKLREVSDREKLKLYGELITANIYRMPENIKSIELQNYYKDNDYVVVPLDENLSPQKNAQRYFKQFAKAKSAFSNTTRQLDDTLREMEYLESVLVLLENCSNIGEIEEIRQELIGEGYMKSSRKPGEKKREKVSMPMHYKSSDGFDIYVGKNNRQNDLLTLKSASSRDLWLHTRNIPGSHVIIKNNNAAVPDRTLTEAALLAALYSKAGMSSNVPVDYTLVKHVKKPPGAKPGKVVYDNFKTIVVTPEQDIISRIENIK